MTMADQDGMQERIYSLLGKLQDMRQEIPQ